MQKSESWCALGVVLFVLATLVCHGDGKTILPAENCTGHVGYAGNVKVTMIPDLVEKKDTTFVLNSQDNYTVDVTFTLPFGVENTSIGKFYVYSIVAIWFNDRKPTSVMIPIFNANSTFQSEGKRDTFEKETFKLDEMTNQTRTEAPWNKTEMRLYIKLFDGNDNVVLCRQMEFRLKDIDVVPEIQGDQPSAPY